MELAVGVDHQLEKIEHVARIQGRGIGRHQRGQIGLADDVHAVFQDSGADLAQDAVAALRHGHVDDHRPRLHGAHRVFADQHRRAPPGNQGRGNDDVGQLRAFVHELRLAPHPVGRHRARIAAAAGRDLALFVGFIRHVDEFRAERLHLLFHRRAHVGRFDHGAQPLGGGDCLQAGHADAHDQHARGLDGAGRRHQHRHEAPVGIGGQQDGLVAGDVRLRRQHVERLRTRDTWRGFQGKGGDAGRGQRSEILTIEGIEHTDQHRVAAHHGQFAGGGTAYLEHQIGAERARGIDDDGTGGFERRVWRRRMQAGAGLHHDLVARGQLFHGLGGGCNTGLARPGFGRNTNSHGSLHSLNCRASKSITSLQ